MAETKPVLIGGAGPTGMTAAIELARMDIPVHLIEKTLQPATTSRAIGVQARTLELFEQRGLVEAMRAAGNPSWRGPSWWGQAIVSRRVCPRSQPVSYVLIVSQVETERILREELARRHVAIERGVELIALAQSDPHGSPQPSDGVSATLRDQGGTLEEVEAAYLISAEGGAQPGPDESRSRPDRPGRRSGRA